MAKKNAKEITVEEKLRALYEMQTYDSEVDKIRTLRGELPLEVQDLEDEIAGLETRISNLNEDLDGLDKMIASRKNEIGESDALIKKYKDQQNNVRNNREYDSLSKEIEYQTLEIELAEKRIKEHSTEIASKKEILDESKVLFEERNGDLDAKRKELESIVEDTKKEEDDLGSKAKSVEPILEDRLTTAYKKIRKNARNGLSVVPVERDACGGCFNKIPPQRQMDIRSRRKIIVCEYCGRILVDSELAEEIIKKVKKKK